MSARSRALVALALAVLAVVAVSALRYCKPHTRAPLAVVVAHAGSIAASRSARPAAFAAAGVGTTFGLGDAVRTAPRATARLRFDDASRLDVRPATTIRFSATRPGQRRARLDVLAGEAVLTVVQATDVETIAGRARLGAGSRVVLRATEDGGLELLLRVGEARIENVSGLITLAARESLEVGADGRPRTRVIPSETTLARPTDSRGPGRDAAMGVGETTGPSILASRIDLTIGVDENLVIRDPRPPTAIGITTGSACPGGAVVEWLVAPGSRVVASARGVGTIPIAFPEGLQRFQVRCRNGETVGEPVGEGRVRVLRSSGQAPLPRAAPETSIDADGRTYNVLYQNQSPSLSVRWPGGPTSAGTVLVATSGSGTRRVTLGAPHHRFAPGAFGDGAVRLHFESPVTGRRSRETRVVFRFDPAAASASLEGPVDGTFDAGGTARVSGTALPGWVVRAAGREIPLGPDRRFAADVPVPANGVVVVTLTRRGQGTHHYVRRARGALP